MPHCDVPPVLDGAFLLSWLTFCAILTPLGFHDLCYLSLHCARAHEHVWLLIPGTIPCFGDVFFPGFLSRGYLGFSLASEAEPFVTLMVSQI